MGRTFIIFLAAALLTACQSSERIGSAKPSAELQRQYDTAFQEMLVRPGDLEVAFKYAGLATQVGDYEGAAATYEGMLLVQSDLPRVRLELGILYYNLKSYGVSRNYLETALQSPNLPPELRRPTEQLLSKVHKRQSRLQGA